MYLIMFDVDGTLTRSYQYDQQCYADTFKALTGLDVDTDWHHYPHVTDSAVTQVLIERHQLCDAIAHQAEQQFAKRLLEMHGEHPEQFQPVTGASEMLLALKARGVPVSIATGCWRDSALIKLQKSGVEVDGLPMATASDQLTRQDIMRESEKRAAEHYGVEQFKGVIYIGDGVWDLRCSAELEYGFIGMGEDITKLAELGAQHTLADYSEPEKFWGLLALQGLQ